MKKITNKLLIGLSLVLLSSCAGGSLSPAFEKEVGNNDFNNPSNLIEADLNIDGVLDEEEWNSPNIFTAVYGETELVPNRCEVKLYWGVNGLTVGWYTTDIYLASSTNYIDPGFVVDSDNVEFYIDTLNDKGQIAKIDDYGFLINPEAYTEMRTGTGSYWGPWSGVVDYGVTYYGTINNDADIDIGWGVELFLPYQTFGFSQDSVVGVAFGCRDRNTNTPKSEWAGWIPDPQIIDTYVSIDKNGILNKNVGDFSVNAGDWNFENEEYVSLTSNSIALANDLEMTGRNGTVSVDMYIGSALTSDNGLIFQVKPSETGLFWEGVGVRYYFWFINKDGIAMLGRTRDGGWATLAETSATYKTNSWNNLKIVVTEKSKIHCFLNGTLLLTHQEALYDTVQVGLRAGAANTRFKNFVCNSSTDISQDVTTITNYVFASGSMDYVDEAKTSVVSMTGQTLLVHESGSFIDGTITSHVTCNSNSDNGLVFRLNDGGKSSYWESDVSYYHYFISAGGTAYLGKVDGGWTELRSVVIPGYSATQTYKVSAKVEGDLIKCFIDDVLMFEVTEATILSGTKYGLRARGIGATFTLPTIS